MHIIWYAVKVASNTDWGEEKVVPTGDGKQSEQI